MNKTKKQSLTDIQKYLLQARALPVSVHYKNPRNQMSKKLWSQISKEAKKRTGYKCELCLNKYEYWNLHAHEAGKIIWTDAKVIFNKIFTLCKMCHRIQHMGLAGIHVDEGKLNIKEFNNHIKEKLKVKKTFDDFFQEFKEFFVAFEPWRMDSAFIPFDYVATVNDFEEPLFSAWKKQEPSEFWKMAKEKSKIINFGSIEYNPTKKYYE